MKKSWVVLLALAVTGCGTAVMPDAPTVALHPVVGRVMFEGKPAVGARVTLHPVEPAALGVVTPGGEVNADGQFAVTTYQLSDGAPQGRYLATVSWSDVLNPGSSDTMYGPEKLPRRYQNPATSKLEVEILPGIGELPVLALSRR